MKNKLFFSCIFMCFALANELKPHTIQEQSAFDELPLSTDLFSSILDNCSPIDASLQLTPLRNAHAIKQDESMLQKLQFVCIRWYAYALCRYHLIKKWFSKNNPQGTTSHS